MLSVIDGHQPYFICSYESFMFWGSPYLESLYRFLGIGSVFSPELKDTNVNKMKKIWRSVF